MPAWSKGRVGVAAAALMLSAQSAAAAGAAPGALPQPPPGSVQATTSEGDLARSAKDPTLRMRGFGPLRLGMTPKEAIATGWVERADDACGTGFQLVSPYDRHAFVIIKKTEGERRHLVRVWLLNGGYETKQGIHVGSTLSTLRETYGKRLSKLQKDHIGHYWARVKGNVKGNQRWLNFMFLSDDGTPPKGSARIAGLDLAEVRTVGFADC